MLGGLHYADFWVVLPGDKAVSMTIKVWVDFQPSTEERNLAIAGA